VRLVVVEDQRLVREGLVELLSSHFEVVGQAANGKEGAELCQRLAPQLALVDVVMPVMDGPACTRAIVESGIATRVLACSTHDSDAHLFSMLNAGAAGFVLKDIETAELVRALQVIHYGHSLLSPSVTRRLIERFGRAGKQLPEGPDKLSPRELDIFERVASGQSNEEIAEAAGVSLSTVKTHVSSLLAKLQCRDRIQLVIRAYESGMIRPGIPSR
jgi:DNA-binding NarL/FixJ family response regulator